MNYLNQGLLFYAFGPPLLALAYCGIIYLGSRRRTQQLDQRIAQYREQPRVENENTNVVSFRRAA
jgi:hypothetical protein